MIRKVPQDFLLGAALSAYQMEGAAGTDGREPSVWDAWFARPGSAYDGRHASDFYHHYEEDIAAAAAHGLQALTLSLSWSRIVHADGTVNPDGLAFYDHVIDSCLAHGVEPFVALYHFDLPDAYAREGWLAPSTTEAYLRYARVCFEQYGDRVRHFLTMKDPVTEVTQGYITGLFPPGQHFALGRAVRALYKMLVAHAQAVLLYKSLGLGGAIGIAHRAEGVYPLTEAKEDVRAARRDDVLTNRMLFDAVLAGRLSLRTRSLLEEILPDGETFAPNDEELEALGRAAAVLDFFGVNYYASHFCTRPSGGASCIRHNGTGERGTSAYEIAGISRRLMREDVPTTDWDWNIFPRGLYEMLLRLHESYRAIPIYITETGLGLHERPVSSNVEDDDRIDYLRQHLAAVLDAMDDGVDVRGLFIWSLIDGLSWTNGYDKRYGLFYVDYATGRRLPKKSADWLRDLAARRLMLTLNAIHTRTSSDAHHH
ncbi:MAG: family 1 glycosylhydrolase [Selenomonadaceae bacterium]|nr:family 1 glycosylhydrolase [Selenomonadaceae bacterium]